MSYNCGLHSQLLNQDWVCLFFNETNKGSSNSVQQKIPVWIIFLSQASLQYIAHLPLNNVHND